LGNFDFGHFFQLTVTVPKKTSKHRERCHLTAPGPGVAAPGKGWHDRGVSTGEFTMSDISALTAAVAAFRDARDWRQFHTLRNLITSLNLEAAELLELTQWKSDAEVEALPADPQAGEALRDECADILLYLLLIADTAGIDLAAAAHAKLAKNGIKYPVEKAYGSRAKYTELG
jgi:NTP pyrophosphatase (non-canonical NTP hydrolase)